MKGKEMSSKKDQNDGKRKKIKDVAGLEPARDKPNRFLVDRLNHSATHPACFGHAESLRFYFIKLYPKTQPNPTLNSDSRQLTDEYVVDDILLNTITNIEQS